MLIFYSNPGPPPPPYPMTICIVYIHIVLCSLFQECDPPPLTGYGGGGVTTLSGPFQIKLYILFSVFLIISLSSEGRTSAMCDFFERRRFFPLFINKIWNICFTSKSGNQRRHGPPSLTYPWHNDSNEKCLFPLIQHSQERTNTNQYCTVPTVQKRFSFLHAT